MIIKLISEPDYVLSSANMASSLGSKRRKAVQGPKDREFENPTEFGYALCLTNDPIEDFEGCLINGYGNADDLLGYAQRYLGSKFAEHSAAVDHLAAYDRANHPVDPDDGNRRWITIEIRNALANDPACIWRNIRNISFMHGSDERCTCPHGGEYKIVTCSIWLIATPAEFDACFNWNPAIEKLELRPVVNAGGDWSNAPVWVHDDSDRLATQEYYSIFIIILQRAVPQHLLSRCPPDDLLP
jgi:hypothetical protein